MGRSTGSEPATSGTTNQRSNQLSYDRHGAMKRETRPIKRDHGMRQATLMKSAWMKRHGAASGARARNEPGSGPGMERAGKPPALSIIRARRHPPFAKRQAAVQQDEIFS